ncbi:hypothetical protein [Lyngbya sp. CCY1209]|uniref:hypothetical protein n=1 Tax=Lyngbya sp. CCY1209 TaxID=2886103 RepID=UPI002D20A40C|nr:hypothetical protein [Lyngbya sp. CCY1209]MEB3884050.1 hypothetical protein [Lyngbya sp. CCY1209]
MLLSQIVIDTEILSVILTLASFFMTGTIGLATVVFRLSQHYNKTLGRLETRIKNNKRDIDACFHMQRRNLSILQVQISHLQGFLEERDGYSIQSLDSLFDTDSDRG